MAERITLKSNSAYTKDIANIPNVPEIIFSVNGVKYSAPSFLYATHWLSENNLYQPENKIVFDL